MTPLHDGGRHVSLLGYHFVARGPELRIEHEFVEPVVVRMEPFAFRVEPPSRERAALRPGAEPDGPTRFALCETDETTEHILQAIAARRRRPIPTLPRPILQGHLLAARRRGLCALNPRAAHVQDALLAIGPHLPRLACQPGFYADPFLSRDVLRYRAAACALLALEEDLYAPWCARRGQPPTGEVASLLEAMRQWRGLFSFNGHPYRSLNRTLMNLPASVPARLLPYLRGFELERPLTEALPLTAVLLHASDDRAARLAEVATGQRKILERASESDVVSAVAALATFTGRDLEATRVEDLAFTVRFLVDYPRPFRGGLGGLVHRAIRWHEEIRAGHRARRHAAAGARPPLPARVAIERAPPALAASALQCTARPPIDLPQMDGIEFLATVDRIRMEAVQMDNCIASYANLAVAGECYLFHVHHRGEDACVEISRRGEVRQAEGPANSNNRAAHWGARTLGEWARGLRPSRPPRMQAQAGDRAALPTQAGGREAQRPLWGAERPPVRQQ